jgi:DNA-binding phage protein
LDAVASGASVANIAEAAGLSKQRIYQVIHERDD